MKWAHMSAVGQNKTTQLREIDQIGRDNKSNGEKIE